MRVEVMAHYGLRQPLSQAGYYETAHHKELLKDVRAAIHEGKLIVKSSNVATNVGYQKPN
jgi:type II secretory pathway predicted ATPase ExeA